MKYFKQLDIDSLDVIARKTLAYVKTKPFIFERQSSTTSLYDFSIAEFLSVVPEIRTEFAKLDLICIRAAVHVMYSNKHTKMHKDSLYPLARINIPILNCEGSKTEFFSNVQVKEWVNPESRVKSFTIVNDDFQFADAVTISKATILRVSEAHNIKIDEDKVPRICLTLGFNNVDRLLKLLDS